MAAGAAEPLFWGMGSLQGASACDLLQPSPFFVPRLWVGSSHAALFCRHGLCFLTWRCEVRKFRITSFGTEKAAGESMNNLERCTSLNLCAGDSRNQFCLPVGCWANACPARCQFRAQMHIGSHGLPLKMMGPYQVSDPNNIEQFPTWPWYTTVYCGTLVCLVYRC